jgi:hypothetical protein
VTRTSRTDAASGHEARALFSCAARVELTPHKTQDEPASQPYRAAMPARSAKPTRSRRPRSRVATTFRYREQFGVIVVCTDEADQRRLYRRLSRDGLRVKVVVV